MAVLFPAYWECESGELQKEKNSDFECLLFPSVSSMKFINFPNIKHVI